MRFEAEIECSDCQASGVYVGMCEHDGLAIVCSRCSGTGKRLHVFEYTPFTKRQTQEYVTHVMPHNEQMVKLNPEHAGGLAMPYADWQKGADFSQEQVQQRAYLCPAQYAQNVAGTSFRSPKLACQIGQTFSRCVMYPTKAACWTVADADGLLAVSRS